MTRVLLYADTIQSSDLIDGSLGLLSRTLSSETSSAAECLPAILDFVVGHLSRISMSQSSNAAEY